LYTPPRQRTRIVPPDPITVAIEDDHGLPLGYGVIANISETGACVWTDGALAPGARLALRVSFARPAEVHEVAAIVVWSDEETEPEGRRRRRYGLQWYDASSSCVLRVRHLAGHREGGHTPPMGTPAPVSA